MTLSSVFNKLSSDFWDVFYPPRCPICGMEVTKEEVLCPACLKSLPRTEQSVLRENSTEQLFRDIRRFERGAAFLFFQHGSVVQDLVLSLKFNERPDIGYALAKQAAREFGETHFFEDIDVIIPVPLHPKRFRERGYNQAEWIARGLSEVTGIPMDTTHIVRLRNNPHQASLKEKDRHANTHGLFTITHPEDLYRKHILLVDDVVTTGSTMRACIKALRTARSCFVSVFALARPQ